MTYRLERLRQRLFVEGEEGLDAILISRAENLRYLSGFTGSAGFLLISEAKSILATDFRYIEQAKCQAPHFEIFHTKGQLREWFPELASSLGSRRIGFEANDMSLAAYRKLASSIGKKHEVVPTEEIVESLRAVKDDGERENIVQAVGISDDACEEFSSLLHIGMTEKEAAWGIERLLLSYFPSTPFSSISELASMAIRVIYPEPSAWERKTRISVKYMTLFLVPSLLLSLPSRRV
jgi:Xaa-Pro aminopeptidase